MTCYKNQPLPHGTLAKPEFPGWMFTNPGTKRANVPSNLETSSSLGCGCEKGSQNPDAQPVTQLTGWPLPRECPVRGPAGFVPIFNFTPRTQVCPPPARFRDLQAVPGGAPPLLLFLAQSSSLCPSVSLCLSESLSPALSLCPCLPLPDSLCLSLSLFHSLFFLVLPGAFTAEELAPSPPYTTSLPFCTTAKG